MSSLNAHLEARIPPAMGAALRLGAGGRLEISAHPGGASLWLYVAGFDAVPLFVSNDPRASAEAGVLLAAANRLGERFGLGVFGASVEGV